MEKKPRRRWNRIEHNTPLERAQDVENGTAKRLLSCLSLKQNYLILGLLVCLSMVFLVYEALHVTQTFQLQEPYNNNNPTASKQAHPSKCAKNHGYIIANMNGRLANNLFQIAMANRLSEELCWDVIFKEGWQGVFPNEKRALQCFPYTMQYQHPYYDKDNNDSPLSSLSNEKKKKWSMVDREIYQKLNIDNYTNHYWSIEEPGKFFRMIKVRETKDMYDMWRLKSQADGTSLRIASRWEFDYRDHWLERLVDDLRNNPRNNKTLDKIRAIHLDGYFIHYDWMKDWMESIQRWNQINVTECCHHLPPSNAVVIHIRNFQHHEGLNPGYKTTVFTEFLNKMYFGGVTRSNQLPLQQQRQQYILWIVCQPEDVNIELVQTLKERYNGTIVTGNDPYDAFCTLQYARELVLSTHSTFSQMAALLSPDKSNANVHYLLPKTQFPEVTLVVPHWHYHLVNQEGKDSIQTYNLPVDDIQPIIS